MARLALLRLHTVQPQQHLVDDFAALNRYVARVQSVLQSGKPDNDILLYWPLADVWDNADGLAKMLTVHDVKFLTEQPVGKIARTLVEKGYQFDYISDAQLQLARAPSGGSGIRTPGGEYRAIIVPKTRRMPVETMQRLLSIAAQGGSVFFLESLPDDVPGHGHLAARRTRLKALLEQWTFKSYLSESGYSSGLPKSDSNREILGFNSAFVFSSIDSLLRALVDRFSRIAQEASASSGLSIVRRRTEIGYDYFMSNLSAHAFEGWLPLGREASSVTVLDPLSGKRGLASRRNGSSEAGARRTETYLQIQSGESVVLSTVLNRDLQGPRWTYRQNVGSPIALSGKWSLTFTQGGPELPPALTTTELKSWTDLGGDEAKRFAGTARYRLEFDAPAAKADDWRLDLGDVRESARVRLNGRDIGTLWSIPLRVDFPASLLKPTGNVLELDVTNLAANRIRDMDGANDPKPDASEAEKAAHPPRKANWKIMREINFVNINYRPFDASGWALTPSGLLGPVTLTPLRASIP